MWMTISVRGGGTLYYDTPKIAASKITPTMQYVFDVFCLSEPLSAHCVSHSTLPVPGAISTVTSKVSPPAKEIYGYLTPCWSNNCLITKHFKSLKWRNPHLYDINWYGYGLCRKKTAPK